MRYVSVPSLILPMNVIVGSILQGSITGTVYGAPSLVSGKTNSALILNGIDQNMVFGKYLGMCFHLPDVCHHESSFAYWLKWKPTARGVIFDSGGYNLSSRDYFHGIQQNGKMTDNIKDATYHFDLNTPSWLYTSGSMGICSSDVVNCLFRQDLFKWLYVSQRRDEGSSNHRSDQRCELCHRSSKCRRQSRLGKY